MKSIATALVCLGLSATLCACSLLGGNDSDSDDAAAEPQSTVELWSTDELTPFSPVTAVDGVGVALATKRKAVFVVGLDPASGHLLWKHEVSPSAVPRGIALRVATAGKLVGLLSPAHDGSSQARLRIVSPLTGDTVAYSPMHRFVRAPSECDDEPGAFCATILKGEDGVTRDVRLSPERPALALDPTPKAGDAYSVSVGDGGLVLGDGKTQRLAVMRGGRRVWAAPVRRLMGPRSDLGNGWNFDLDEKADRFVGSVGRSGRVGDLTDEATAAFGATDGRSLWRDEGSSLGCNGILGPVRVDKTEKSYLRCRTTGTGTWSRRKGEFAFVTKKLSVTLERFDPATGSTTWKVPLGAARGLVVHDEDGGRLVVDDRRQIFVAGQDRTTVDLVTGEAVPTDPKAVAWCVKRARQQDPLGVKGDDGTPLDVRGGELAQPCDAEANPLDVVPTNWPSSLVARFAGGVGVYASPTAFLAYGPRSAVRAIGAPTPSGVPQSDGTTVAWRSKNRQPYSAVQNVDGVAVAVVRKGKSLYATGLDPAVGKELWRHELSLANVDRFFASELVAAGDKVGFYTAAGSGPVSSARFTLVDAQTGSVIGRSAARPFVRHPWLCLDRSGDICTVSATDPNSSEASDLTAWRFSAADARLTPDEVRTAAIHHSIAGLGVPGAFLAMKGYQQQLGQQKSGRVRWQKAVAKFTAYGSYLNRVTYDFSSDLIVLSPHVHDGDLSKTETVGVKRANGAVAWRNKGSENDCGQDSTSPMLRTGGPYSSGPKTSSFAPVAFVFLRCRTTGHLEVTGFDSSTLTGGRVVVERFDPASGRTMWKVDLGRAPALLHHGDADASPWMTRVVDDAHLAFGTGKDHVVVDVRTGKAAPAARDQPAWCWETVDEPYRVPLENDLRLDDTVNSGPLLVRCTLDGKASKAGVDQVPSVVGTAFDGGLTLVATPTAFVAYRL